MGFLERALRRAAGRLHPADYPSSWNGRVPIDGVTAPAHASRWQSVTATTIGPSWGNVFGDETRTPENVEQVNNYADYVGTRGFVPSTSVPVPGWDDLAPDQQQRLLAAHNESRLSSERTRLRDKFQKEQDWTRRTRAATQQTSSGLIKLAREQQAQRRREERATAAARAPAAAPAAGAAAPAPVAAPAWLAETEDKLDDLRAGGRWPGKAR